MFTVQIETSNAAFAESPGMEVASILGGLMPMLEDLSPTAVAGGVLRDVNGNRVGTWSLT